MVLPCASPEIVAQRTLAALCCAVPEEVAGAAEMAGP
jgi:hypothetical protein